MLPRESEGPIESVEEGSGPPPGSVAAIWRRGVTGRYVFLLITAGYLVAFAALLRPAASMPGNLGPIVLWGVLFPGYFGVMVGWGIYLYYTCRCPSCNESLLMRTSSFQPVKVCPFCGSG